MRILIITIFAFITSPLLADATPAPDGARAYFISPADGALLKSPVLVVFGLSGMGVAPAGTQRDKTGHHHLIIDVDLPSGDRPIPADDNHRHFGGGQTEFSIELKPGKHQLQLLFADWKHVPHEPVVASDKITITVTE